MTQVDTGVQAVLWDMDGTLVDTEPYWFRAEADLLAAHDIPWSHQQAAALVGGNSLPTSAAVLRAAGIPFDVREIIDTLLESVIAQVRRQVPWRPGARELLTAVRDVGIPCAMVTMSERPLAAEIDGLLPDGTFEFLVTGDMVVHGKPPHPEPYLRAVEGLRGGRWVISSTAGWSRSRTHCPVWPPRKLPGLSPSASRMSWTCPTIPATRCGRHSRAGR